MLTLWTYFSPLLFAWVACSTDGTDIQVDDSYTVELEDGVITTFVTYQFEFILDSMCRFNIVTLWWVTFLFCVLRVWTIYFY